MQGANLFRSVAYARCSAPLARNARFLATKPPGSAPSSSKTSETPPQSTAETASGSKGASESPSDTASSSAETASPSPSSLSLDFSPAADSQPDDRPAGRTGAKSSKDSLSSIERRRRFLARAALALLGLGAVVGTVQLGREWEMGELQSRKIRIEDAPTTRLGRTKTRFADMFDFFSKPTWDELLPPPLPAPYQKPYTLLLSIDDLLVTSTWDRQNGWRTAKRPGVDYFLAYLAQFYEIVIFTSQYGYTANPIIEKLDPYQFSIAYRLFRESTRSVNGVVKKDLTYLNRDLSKVILMDTDPDHVSLQPENSIVIPKWKGDPRDKGLVAMIPFLESIAIYKPQDVRPIIEAYHGKDIPIEYGKKEAEAKAQFIEEWKRSGKSQSGGGGFSLSALFGGNQQETGPIPLTYLEQKRKEAQKSYHEEIEYLKQNKDKLDQLLEEDKQRAAAQMTGNLFTMMQAMTGPPPPGSPPQASGNQQPAASNEVAKTSPQ